MHLPEFSMVMAEGTSIRVIIVIGTELGFVNSQEILR